jgi:hypothetical protein
MQTTPGVLRTAALAGWGLVAFVGAAAGASGCSSDVKAAGPTQRSVVLAAAAPRQAAEISAFAVAPAMLTLVIDAIDNPSAQGFSIATAVTWSGTDASAVELGVVTPVPDAPSGSFVLSIPEAARMLLMRRDGRLSLRLSLLPIAADRPLTAPFQVTIREPKWP